MRRQARLQKCLSAVAMAGLAVVSASLLLAEVPPRTLAGQTLEVPDEQLDQGLVYHVTPGEDVQLVAISRAPLQRLAATTSRIVGYVVVPFDLEEEEPPILAGGFRLPVASLRTSVDGGEDQLSGESFLDRSHHPEILVEIRSVSNVNRIRQSADETVFELTLEGSLFVKGNSRPFSTPARLRLLPSSFRAMARFVGDLAFLECAFSVKPADFGWAPPSPALKELFGDEIQLDLFLTLNTVSPDKSGDPRDDPAIYAKQLHVLTTLRDLDDPEGGYEFVRGFIKEIWDNGQELDRLAQAIAFADGIKTRAWWLAAQAERRASELAEDKDHARLSALARMQRSMGDLKGAIEWMKKAVALTEEGSSERQALAEFEKEMSQRQR